jgi:hypothetical protein
MSENISNANVNNIQNGIPASAAPTVAGKLEIIEDKKGKHNRLGPTSYSKGRFLGKVNFSERAMVFIGRFC